MRDGLKVGNIIPKTKQRIRFCRYEIMKVKNKIDFKNNMTTNKLALVIKTMNLKYFSWGGFQMAKMIHTVLRWNNENLSKWPLKAENVDIKKTIKKSGRRNQSGKTGQRRDMSMSKIESGIEGGILSTMWENPNEIFWKKIYETV